VIISSSFSFYFLSSAVILSSIIHLQLFRRQLFIPNCFIFQLFYFLLFSATLSPILFIFDCSISSYFLLYIRKPVKHREITWTNRRSHNELHYRQMKCGNGCVALRLFNLSIIVRKYHRAARHADQGSARDAHARTAIFRDRLCDFFAICDVWENSALASVIRIHQHEVDEARQMRADARNESTKKTSSSFVEPANNLPYDSGRSRYPRLSCAYVTTTPCHLRPGLNYAFARKNDRDRRHQAR